MAQCMYLLLIQLLMTFTETSMVLKIFFTYCVFKPMSCSTNIHWNHPFLSVIVKIQFQNIFNLYR